MQKIEQLIEELRKLIGHGATAQRLPSLLNLRACLGVPPDIPYKAAGRIMQRELLRRIRALDGLYVLMGRPVTAEQVKLALQVLLRYDCSIDDAPTRRVIAMRHLGVTYSVETWRRPLGPERELLAILAESLSKQPDRQTT